MGKDLMRTANNACSVCLCECVVAVGLVAGGCNLLSRVRLK